VFDGDTEKVDVGAVPLPIVTAFAYEVEVEHPLLAAVVNVIPYVCPPVE
jgi:hypothetical protein